MGDKWVESDGVADESVIIKAIESNDIMFSTNLMEGISFGGVVSTVLWNR